MSGSVHFGGALAALVVVLLHMSSFMTNANDVNISPAASTCDCCYVSANSDCCLDCLARSPELSALAPLSELLSGREDAGDPYGAADVSTVSEADVKEARGWLPGCRCCFRERLLHQRPRHSLWGASCCSLCRHSRQVVLNLQASRGALQIPAVSGGYGGGGSADSGGDAGVADEDGGRVQKRMSMECLCCSNSGIAACCSNCRLMV